MSAIITNQHKEDVAGSLSQINNSLLILENLAQTEIFTFNINDGAIAEANQDKCTSNDLSSSGKSCICPSGKDFDVTCSPAGKQIFAF
jgi:hypothetical protein